MTQSPEFPTSEPGSLEAQPTFTGTASSGFGQDISDFTPLTLPTVSLVTQTDTGLVEVQGLTLIFDDAGMTVRKSTGDLVKMLPWASLLDITVEDFQQNPIDPIASAVSVATDRRSHEFRVKGVGARDLSDDIAKLAKQFTSSQGIIDNEGTDLKTLLPWLIFIASVLAGLGMWGAHLAGHLAT
ncbi:MAG: hypothetical protein HKL80_02790 [Acidimicrobiales bacterium]|nr:hypothetical protein [Acidimicrobiales bacterium]